MCKKILVGYNGTILAQKALKTAIKFASNNQTTQLEFLYVIEDSTPKMDGISVFEDIKIQLQKLEIPSVYYEKEGAPETIILNHAKENNCDLIFLGGGNKRNFFDSVGCRVVQFSTIPVLIVK